MNDSITIYWIATMVWIIGEDSDYKSFPIYIYIYYLKSRTSYIIDNYKQPPQITTHKFMISKRRHASKFEKLILIRRKTEWRRKGRMTQGKKLSAWEFLCAMATRDRKWEADSRNHWNSESGLSVHIITMGYSTTICFPFRNERFSLPSIIGGSSLIHHEI